MAHNRSESDDVQRPLSKEWKCNSNERLTGHEPYLRACHWKGIARMGEADVIRFWCVGFDVPSNGSIKLHGVIIDSSDRVDGVALTTRLTWHVKVVLVNACVSFFPFEPSGVVPTNAPDTVTTQAGNVP